MAIVLKNTTDGRLTFAYQDNLICTSVAKMKMFFYDRGAYRQDKRDQMSLHTLKEFLRHQISTDGWQRLGSIYGSSATAGYLNYLGFKAVVIDQDAGTFTCGVRLFGRTLDRETYNLPRWLQFFLDLETKTNRGGLSNQALLSTWDSANVLWRHWLARNNVITVAEIAANTITASRMQHDFNVAEDKRVEAQLAASAIPTRRHYAVEDGET